ncbi:hypothetical protein GmHk_02G004018 [Glycine max]|nr:hypothetical protein GmHk_02G004018 [Glycine max]
MGLMSRNQFGPLRDNENPNSAANVTAQVNSISMLNGTNFKVWKEAVEIVLGCMDLDLALRTKRSISTPKTSNEIIDMSLMSGNQFGPLEDNWNPNRLN